MSAFWDYVDGLYLNTRMTKDDAKNAALYYFNHGIDLRSAIMEIRRRQERINTMTPRFNLDREITIDIMHHRVFEIEDGFRLETYYDDTDNSYYAFLHHTDFPDTKSIICKASVLRHPQFSVDDDRAWLEHVSTLLDKAVFEYYADLYEEYEQGDPDGDDTGYMPN